MSRALRDCVECEQRNETPSSRHYRNKDDNFISNEFSIENHVVSNIIKGFSIRPKQAPVYFSSHLKIKQHDYILLNSNAFDHKLIFNLRKSIRDIMLFK